MLQTSIHGNANIIRRKVRLFANLFVKNKPWKTQNKTSKPLHTWRTCLYCSSKLHPAALPSDEEDDADPAGCAGGGGAGARNAGGVYAKLAPPPARENTLLGADNDVPCANDAKEDRWGCSEVLRASKSSRPCENSFIRYCGSQISPIILRNMNKKNRNRSIVFSQTHVENDMVL